MSQNHKSRHLVEKSADHAHDVIEEVKDNFSGLLEDAKDKSEELLESAVKQGNKFWDKAQDQGEEAWQGARIWIAKNPGVAVGWAFMAGALMYAHFARSDRS